MVFLFGSGDLGLVSFAPQMPHKYLALELQLQPSVLEREPQRNRQRVAHHVGIPKSPFKTVICQGARFEAHPGALEAAGLALLFKWLLQSASRHNRRIIILLDARAILGAAQRGRTSARSKQREIRRIAALQLAGNLRVHFLYVPSEDNPADAPSITRVICAMSVGKHFGCGDGIQTLKSFLCNNTSLCSIVSTIFL